MTEHLSTDKLNFWEAQADQMRERVKRLGTDCCEQPVTQAARLRAQWAEQHGIVDVIVLANAVKLLVEEIIMMRGAELLDACVRGEICPVCDGSGEGSHDGIRCARCDGLGVATEESARSVDYGGELVGRHDEFGNIT